MTEETAAQGGQAAQAVPADEGPITINGKQVHIKSHFPARDNWDLPQVLMAFANQGSDKLDMQRVVPALPRLIESWEFEGDPAEEDAYGDLDLFRELIPLVREVSTRLAVLMGAGGRALGEAEKGSTSQ